MSDRSFSKAVKPKSPLISCPFCGDPLIEKDDHHGTWYEHPSAPGPCIISHIQLFDQDDYDKWNQRVGCAPPPTPIGAGGVSPQEAK